MNVPLGAPEYPLQGLRRRGGLDAFTFHGRLDGALTDVHDTGRERAVDLQDPVLFSELHRERSFSRLAPVKVLLNLFGLLLSLAGLDFRLLLVLLSDGKLALKAGYESLKLGNLLCFVAFHDAGKGGLIG